MIFVAYALTSKKVQDKLPYGDAAIERGDP
jgi:hypothetical protein